MSQSSICTNEDPNPNSANPKFHSNNSELSELKAPPRKHSLETYREKTITLLKTAKAGVASITIKVTDVIIRIPIPLLGINLQQLAVGCGWIFSGFSKRFSRFGKRAKRSSNKSPNPLSERQLAGLSSSGKTPQPPTTATHAKRKPTSYSTKIKP